MTKLLRSSRRATCAVAAITRVLVGAVLLAATLAAPAYANSKYAGLVVDVISGKTLYSDHADSKRYPASLTKIMTLYIVFEEMKAGRINLDTKFTVSKYAAARPPSKIGFKPGGQIAVRDAIKALVTKSANDVATAIAENISGTEARFAQRMTKTARRLGMNSTTFRNASGLPNPNQSTTARDMARLGIAIQRDFPQYYGVFQTRTFSFGKRRYRNHNKLLGRVKGVDGIKTGYIRASGFNLVTSVRRDGRHIVAVVMGGKSGASRNKHMTALVGRYLPKATRGTPIQIAKWSDRRAAPKPQRKPVDALLVARLKRAETPAPSNEPDAISSLLAFASDTRAAVRSPATPAIAAVIAQANPAPAPAAIVPAAIVPPTPGVDAAIALAALSPPPSAKPAGAIVPSPLGAARRIAVVEPTIAAPRKTPSRVAFAFESLQLSPHIDGVDGLIRALKAGDGRSTVQIGSTNRMSAPGPGGPGRKAREAAALRTSALQNARQGGGA